MTAGTGLEALLLYLGVGALAGTLAGLLGVGGGIIIVPALAFLFEVCGFDPAGLMHLAIGTSLATIVLTSLSAVRAHHRRESVLWGVFSQLGPGLVLGALAGSALASRLPSQVLQQFFGVFVLLVAAQMGLGLQPPSHRGLPRWPAMLASGAAIGGLSGIVGIGGGSLTVPLLTWCNVPVRLAVGTSAACGLPIALAGAVGYVATGWGQAELPPGSLGYVYLPAFLGIAAASMLFAPVGAWLAHKLPAAALKRGFAVFLAVVGVRMLLG